MEPGRKGRCLFASGILLLLVSLTVTVALADGSGSGGSYAAVDAEKVAEGRPKDGWPDSLVETLIDEDSGWSSDTYRIEADGQERILKAGTGELGAYRILREYDKDSAAAEGLQGRGGIAAAADLPLDGATYVKASASVERPDFKGTACQYHSVVYGTMEEGERYSPDSMMTSVAATGDGREILLADIAPEPQTGDSSLTQLWAAVCVASLLGGAALILTAIFKKKS